MIFTISKILFPDQYSTHNSTARFVDLTKVLPFLIYLFIYLFAFFLFSVSFLFFSFFPFFFCISAPCLSCITHNAICSLELFLRMRKNPHRSPWFNTKSQFPWCVRCKPTLWVDRPDTKPNPQTCWAHLLKFWHQRENAGLYVWWLSWDFSGL